MSWEIIACCVWVIAIIWCISEAYFAPTMSEDDFTVTPKDKLVNKKSYDLLGGNLDDVHMRDGIKIVEKKLHISNDQVIKIYQTQGCQAVIERYLEADEFTTQKGIASQVTKIMDINPDFGYELNNIDKWNKISEAISDASIKKGFK